MPKPITAEMCHELLYYSEGGRLLWKETQEGRRHAYANQSAAYVDNNGSRRVCIYGGNYSEKYLIWIMHGGDPADSVYNINKDTDDNRIENLAPCRRGTGRYEYSWFCRDHIFTAHVKRNGVKHDAGRFTDYEEMMKAVRDLKYKLQLKAVKEKETSNQLG